MDSTQRFSTRVEAYVKYRPSYPAAMLDFLTSELAMGPDARVADIGAGTGILTALLAPRVARVWAVEPNAEMRGRPGTNCRQWPLSSGRMAVPKPPVWRTGRWI